MNTGLKPIGHTNLMLEANGLMEFTKKTELSLDISWRNSNYSNLELGFELVNFKFAGKSNSPIEFEMLQGLRNGQNML
ncbi:MAG: hypothetical protein ACO3MG_06145 [Saprospiraceae bacterium]|jgi:hypothetical protein